MREVSARQNGLLDLSFARRNDRTVIERRLFTWPFVLTRSFSVDPCRPQRLSVIVQTGSGAVHGEDSLSQRLVLGPGSEVCLTNQGATSVHRADPAHRSNETMSLDVADGASLEYLPEARILFPDAATAQSVDLECASGGSALIFDAFTMYAPSEQARSFRELESTFCLRRLSGDPLIVDRTRLYRPSPEVFRGYRGFASAFLIWPASHDLANLRDRLTGELETIPGLYAATTVLPSSAGLGVRLAALDLRFIRAALESIKAIYRRALLNSVDLDKMQGNRAAEPTMA